MIHTAPVKHPARFRISEPLIDFLHAAVLVDFPDGFKARVALAVSVVAESGHRASRARFFRFRGFVKHVDEGTLAFPERTQAVRVFCDDGIPVRLCRDLKECLCAQTGNSASVTSLWGNIVLKEL